MLCEVVDSAHLLICGCDGGKGDGAHLPDHLLGRIAVHHAQTHTCTHHNTPHAEDKFRKAGLHGMAWDVGPPVVTGIEGVAGARNVGKVRRQCLPLGALRPVRIAYKQQAANGKL